MLKGPIAVCICVFENRVCVFLNNWMSVCYKAKHCEIFSFNSFFHSTGIEDS